MTQSRNVLLPSKINLFHGATVTLSYSTGSWRALVKGKLRRFSLQSPFTALHTTEYVKFFGYRESCEKSDKTEMKKNLRVKS